MASTTGSPACGELRLVVLDNDRPSLSCLPSQYISRAIVEAAADAGAAVVEKGSLNALRRAIRG